MTVWGGHTRSYDDSGGCPTHAGAPHLPDGRRNAGVYASGRCHTLTCKGLSPLDEVICFVVRDGCRIDRSTYLRAFDAW
jgi:hypothetical protein